MKFFRIWAMLLALLLPPDLAGAWSNKEHIQLTRIAALLLIEDDQTPAEMRQWLLAATPGLLDLESERAYFLNQRIGIVPSGVEGLAFWAVAPDMMALIDKDEREVQPFGVNERLLHFLDVEIFQRDEGKRTYNDDLSHKPAAGDFPRDMTDFRYKRAGMLPFRIEQCHRRLIELISGGRLTDKPGQFPRDEHAARWAGMLAHYAQDNTQPQHATVDYKSASYFSGASRAPNVHAEMEYRMCDDEMADFMPLREEFWPIFIEALNAFEDPIATDDPWPATIEVTLTSYDALPLIGAAARAAVNDRGEIDTEKFFHHRGRCMGREMTLMQLKARQQAWAVRRTMRLWRSAWDIAEHSNTNP